VQFFASPFLGVLWDRFGRRPVILLSCLGARARLRVHGTRACRCPGCSWDESSRA
jgi:MFS family permease